MSWFTIPKSFVEGQKAKASEIDQDFQAVADAFNGLFESGVVKASGNLTLGAAYADVPGAKLDITPAIPSILRVTAVFDFELTGRVSGLNADIGLVGIGGLTCDGVVQDGAAISRASLPKLTGIEASAPVFRGTVTQVYSITLPVGAHTIKMQAKCEGAITTAKALEDHTRISYLLIPNPEP